MKCNVCGSNTKTERHLFLVTGLKSTHKYSFEERCTNVQLVKNPIKSPCEKFSSVLTLEKVILFSTKSMTFYPKKLYFSTLPLRGKFPPHRF